MEVYVVVCGFIVFDIITGVTKALYKEGLNSTYLRKGLFHKLSEILAIIGCGLIEYAGKYVNLGIDLPIVNGVAIYICMMELISIVENISVINPRLAKLFKPYLEKLKEKCDDDDYQEWY